MKKFRYVYSDGENVKIFFLTLDEIENKGVLGNTLTLALSYRLINRDRFTGLVDKKGNEIYENDKVKFKNKILFITWSNIDCRFYATDIKIGTPNINYNFREDMAKNRLEVIGNKYE